MLPKKWEIKDKNPTDILESLLKNRGIEDRESFLDPKNPLNFTFDELGVSEENLQNAVEKIILAKDKGETVVIYGDYDVDGTCATSLLWTTLHDKGLKVFPFIPDRFSDGYGMTISGLNKICERYSDVKVIVTVDNGIVAHEAIKEAQTRGIFVIVTDHHEISQKNEADILVHSTKICGTAIAWCLCREILKDSKKSQQNLDLVGIATIADQMKLVGVNRSFAYHGIAAIHDSSRAGIRALCETAEIVLTAVGTYEIGYIIGPRINAAGRLGDALTVVRLLCTGKMGLARDIAAELSDLNLKRQDITKTVLDAAREQTNGKSKILLVVGDFHEGVIGLAAGKLVEETGRPAIVFSKGEKHTKASARSILGFNVTKALREFEKMFVNVGGHEMAAGLTIETAKLPEFLEKFEMYVQENLSDDLFLKKLIVDCEVPFSDVTKELFVQLNKMEPFGNGNPKPIFATFDTTVRSLKPLGKTGDHLKLNIRKDSVTFEALLFRAKQWSISPKVGSNLDLVYSIDENTWNGNSTLQLLIKDFHEHVENKQSDRKKVSKSSRSAPQKN